MIGKQNSPGNFALRDRDFGFTKTPPEHSGSGNQATTGPKSRYIFENPNSEHPRARQDPQSTIFSNFFAENDARTSGKPVGPVLTPKKALKKSKFHKTPESPKIQIFQPKKEKACAKFCRKSLILSGGFTVCVFARLPRHTVLCTHAMEIGFRKKRSVFCEIQAKKCSDHRFGDLLVQS